MNDRDDQNATSIALQCCGLFYDGVAFTCLLFVFAIAAGGRLNIDCCSM